MKPNEKKDELQVFVTPFDDGFEWKIRNGLFGVLAQSPRSFPSEGSARCSGEATLKILQTSIDPTPYMPLDLDIIQEPGFRINIKEMGLHTPKLHQYLVKAFTSGKD